MFSFFASHTNSIILGSICSHQLVVFSRYPDFAIVRGHQQGFLERSDMQHLTIKDANKHRE